MLNFPRRNALASLLPEKPPRIFINQVTKTVPEIALPGSIYLLYADELNAQNNNYPSSPLSEHSLPFITDFNSQRTSPSVVLPRDEAIVQLKQNRKFIKGGLFWACLFNK